MGSNRPCVGCVCGGVCPFWGGLATGISFGVRSGRRFLFEHAESSQVLFSQNVITRSPNAFFAAVGVTRSYIWDKGRGPVGLRASFAFVDTRFFM